MNNDDADRCLVQLWIVPHRVTHEVVQGADGLHARKAATRGDEGQEPAPSSVIVPERGFFQERDDAIAQQRRVGEALDRHGPLRYAGNIERVGLGPHGDEQVIELEIALESFHAADATHRAHVHVNTVHLGLDKSHVTKNASYRIDNVARVKLARRHFVQHRSEQHEILAAHERHVDIRAARESLVEIHGRAEPCEAAARYDDLHLLRRAHDRGAPAQWTATAVPESRSVRVIAEAAMTGGEECATAADPASCARSGEVRA
jgi:hypothetical protein